MGTRLVFEILAFNPTVTPDAETQLPIDPADITRQLQDMFPTGEVRVDKSDDEVNILVYITTEKYGPWIVAQFMEHPSYFSVSGWPKRIAKELILWYRQYVPMNYPLFLVIPSSGYVAELTADTTLDDIENMYPFPVSDD